ncbi:aldehyde dehydrogenase family protein [Acrocarpospora sp. B8E8]|uniref:aldehyde dehydrogenase family protein n=1 Tax=Acrocarpospora sp. B8E8 TaxID=3153572 RepID=UPI00325FB801
MTDGQFAPTVHHDVEPARKMLIGGEWVGAISGKTFPVYDPADGRVIVEVPAGDAADVDHAVAAARAAFAPGGPWRPAAPSSSSPPSRRRSPSRCWPSSPSRPVSPPAWSTTSPALERPRARPSSATATSTR